MYTITVDAPANWVEVEFAGMLSVDDAALYVFELQRAFIAGRLRTGYGMIIDVAQCATQSHETMAAMRTHMASTPKAGAIGIIAGVSPARTQVERLFTQSYARVADTADEARAWVMSKLDKHI
jgi:hypothetical protein